LESTDGVSDRFSVDVTAKKCASAKRRPNRFCCSFGEYLRSSNRLEIQATRRRR
jgi:hypothetical protein